MNPLQAIVDYFLNHPGQIVWVLVIGSSLLQFWARANKSLAEARKTAEEEAERRRRGAAAEFERQERDPNRQSYQGYLERTKQEQLEANKPSELFGKQSRTIADDVQRRTTSDARSSQDGLRETLARKMAQAPAQQPTSTPSNPLNDLLKELFGEGAATPAQKPAAQKQNQSRPATPATNAPQRQQRPVRADFKPTPVTPSIHVDLAPELQARIGGRREGEASVFDLHDGLKPPTGQTGTRKLLAWSKDDLMRSLIVSEVLGPPKSRRRS